MSAPAWENVSDEELDALRSDLEDAQGARSALEEQRDRLIERIEKLEEANERVLERMEGIVAEPYDFHLAAERLLGLLDQQLGCERYGETNEVHDLFSAMRELRDAMGDAGWRARCDRARTLLLDEGRPGDHSDTQEAHADHAPEDQAP